MSSAQEHPWPPSFFRREAQLFIPNGLARSPWDKQAIAGGPVSALLACGAEDSALDEQFEIARFAVDIFGKAPHQPLTMQVDALRDGRQTKLHCVTALADGRPVAQAHVLRVLRQETPVFAPFCDYPPPGSVPLETSGLGLARMAGAIAHRHVEGGPGKPGRGVAWLSMGGEIIAGEAPSQFVKAAFFADFGNGFGNVTAPSEWSFANLDITIQFLRMPVGDWLLIDAETHMAGNGHGTARNVFADTLGVYARGFQTIFGAPGHLSQPRRDKAD